MKCPLCKGNLEPREVAPCHHCGGYHEELKDFADGIHEYFRCSIFGQELVLCDFCKADFGSFEPDYFGLPEERANDYFPEMICKIDNPRLEKDEFCPQCKNRLAFLIFLKKAREHNSNDPSM